MSALKQFWQSRSDSERRTLSIAGTALALIILWQFVVQPIRREWVAMNNEVVRLDQALLEINGLMRSRKTPSTGAPAPSSSDASLTAVIDQMVRAKNMQSGLKNITPGESGKVALELGGVNFDQLMQMLEQLESEHQVRLLEMGVDTLGSSTVNAKLTLGR